MKARPLAVSARDGLRLAALEWPGDPARAPLLCLPGICRTARDFAALARRHAGRRRVVALDYAGHGESARAADTVVAMRRARPDMGLVALPGTGHAPTLEEAVAAAALDAFIEAVP